MSPAKGASSMTGDDIFLAFQGLLVGCAIAAGIVVWYNERQS